MKAFAVFLIPWLLLPAIEVRTPPSLASRYCSIVVGGAELMSDKATLFIGTATNDSLPADRVRKTGQSMGKSYIVNGPRHSQIIHVERLSTKAPASLRDAIRLANNRVLLIPWSYHADCSVATYEGSALWLSPLTRALFGATLRPRTDWVNGIPTFDTGHPRNTPFPVASAYDRERTRREALSPDDMLSLADSIRRYHSGPLGAVARYLTNKKRWEAILRWADSHPDHSALWPLSDYVESAKRGIATASFDTIISPVAGTYRFVIDIPGQDSIVFFGRTSLRPNSLLQTRFANEPRNYLTAPHGYYLIVCAAKSISDLPSTSRAPAQGYLALSLKPRLLTRDSVAWDAGLDLMRPALEVTGDSGLKSASKEAADYRRSQYSTEPVDFTAGRMVRLSSGKVRVIHILYGKNGVIASIRGTRISKETCRISNTG